MEMRQIKYFIELVNYKNFSKASSSLFITQPALTKSVKQMEDELGVCLIDRSSNTFQLTDYGTVFYQQACEIYNMFLDLNNIASDVKDLNYGNVTIGTMVIASKFFRDLLTYFTQNHPGITINIKEKSSLALLKDLQTNLCDIAFILLPAGDLSGLKSISIGKEPMQAVMCRDDPLMAKQVIEVDDLRNRSVVLFNDDYQPHLDILDLCIRKGFSLNVVNSAPRLQLLIHMLILRRGITFLPASYVKEFIAIDYPEIAARPFQYQLNREVALVYCENRYCSYAVHKVIDYSLEYFSNPDHDFVRRKIDGA